MGKRFLRPLLLTLLLLVVLSPGIMAHSVKASPTITSERIILPGTGFVPRLDEPGPGDWSPPVNTSPTGSLGPGSSIQSSLSLSEALIVMGPGYMVDMKTGKRSLRPAMSGLKRENFLLSWEAHRKRSGIVQGIPVDLAYSQAPIGSIVKFD